MKRISGLWEQITDARNITAAAWRAAQGKRQRPEVASFFSRLDVEVAAISYELRNGAFRFGEYRAFSIRDPKARTIHAPPFRDRVVHHSIIAIAGPVLEKGAVSTSYACRAGRGQHAAIAKAREWMRRGDSFLKLDIAKYYDSIPHGLLQERLERRFRERALLALWDGLLASYAAGAARRGLPIGALTSQYLGNFFLDGFDHWAVQTCGTARYLRYMDDMLFLADHATLASARGAAVGAFAGMGLRVKDGGVLNRCALGVPWLGFTLYPDRARLNANGRRRLRRKLATLERGHLAGHIAEDELQQRGDSLFAHARTGDDAGWRRTVLGLSRLWEAQEPASLPPGRLVEQPCHKLPRRDSQQEPSRQQEQEHRFPGGAGSRHAGALPADVAPSSAPARAGDETTRKTPPLADIHTEKARGGAAAEGAK